MEIIVLMENTTVDPVLAVEPGLSLYIETQGRRILFDTGMSGSFADNAEKMGVDLSRVDMAIISHGHDDHGGGVRRFLELNHTAPVYINKNAFRPFYARETTDLSLDPALKAHPQVVLTDDRCVIGEGLELFTCNGLERKHRMGHFGLTTLSDGKHIPDDFRHEQYLLITEGEKKLLISGCSHKGILNIMEWVDCDVLLGGFHFMRLALEGEDRRQLEESAHTLMTCPTVFYTCHCTGLKQYALMKEIMGEQLRYAATGQRIIL